MLLKDNRKIGLSLACRPSVRDLGRKKRSWDGGGRGEAGEGDRLALPSFTHSETDRGRKTKSYNETRPTFLSLSFHWSALPEYCAFMFRKLFKFQPLQCNVVGKNKSKPICYDCTGETAYKVAFCPRGNLLYMQIYLLTELKLLWSCIFGL